MENVHIEDILQWTGADVVGILEAHLPVPGISTDSRSLRQGDVFLALSGDRFNGHEFVGAAFAAGAGAAVVEGKWVGERTGGQLAGPLLVVPSAERALGAIGRHYRARFDLPVIGVVGSAGKTTTKEMIAAVLQSTYEVLKTAGTENNEVGVPKTLLQLNQDHGAVVLELAARKKGDIEYLCSITQPMIGLLLNIGTAHLEHFGTVEGVAEAKGELLDCQDESCLALVNADDCVVVKEVKRTKGRLLTFSLEREGYFRGEGLVLDQEGRGHFSLQHYQFDLKIPGRHNVYNALAAIGVGRELGVPWERIQAALAAFDPLPLRGEVLHCGGARIVNDSYNANPGSMQSSLETLAAIDTGGGRRIAVLGDMLELGPEAPRYHENIGRRVVELGFDLLMTTGPLSVSFVAGAVAAGMEASQANHFSTREELTEFLRATIRTADLVLVKASRGIGLDEVVDAMTT